MVTRALHLHHLDDLLHGLASALAPGTREMVSVGARVT